MKQLRFVALFAALLGACSFSAAEKNSNTSEQLILVGSTPGDDAIKDMLALPRQTKIDFIRWRLQLNSGTKEGTFTLHINYGESKQNTLGFLSDGERQVVEGTWSVEPVKNKEIEGNIYECSSNHLKFSLLQLNENLFHLLLDAGLMTGNAGWSYTLNREDPIITSKPVAGIFISTLPFDDTATQLTFDGRTPCKSFAEQYNYHLVPECFKLKWRLVLYRDPVTKQPTTYSINRTASRDKLLTGRWSIQPHPVNGKARVIQLDPGNGAIELSLLVGDRNVLFFLDKNYVPYVGNKDFSYTLNRITR